MLYLTTPDPTAPGPITSLLAFTATTPLNRAGTFRLTVAAGDPRTAQLTPRQTVTCHVLANGEWQVAGGGIIRTVTDRGDGTLLVEGDDLLSELATRRLLNVPLYNETTHTPTLVIEQSGTFTTLTNATDGNPATYDTVSLGATGDFLYIGLPFGFNAATFTLSLGNTQPAASHWGFSDSTGGWREPYITDGTETGGNPLAQSGIVSFIRPGAWTLRTINGLTYYWLRLDPSAAIGPIRINTLTATVLSPEMNDIAELMSYAPPGWSLTGYSGTINGSSTVWAGETLLLALVQIAERTGERFRLAPASGRTLHWLRTSTPTSGITLIDPPPGGNGVVEDDVAVMLHAQCSMSAPTLTRVYPFGAGNATARITLSETDRTPPAGITLDLAANCLINTAAELTYGRVEGLLTRPDIRPPDGATAPDRAASNALFDAARAHLQTHSITSEIHTVTLAGLPALSVGATILWNNITYHILQTEIRIDNDGILTTTLTLSPQPTSAQSGDDVLARLVEQAQAVAAHPQGIAEVSVK